MPSMKTMLPLFLLGASGLAAPTLRDHDARDYDLHDGPKRGPPCVLFGVLFENAHETRQQLRDGHSGCKPNPDHLLLDKLLTICIEDDEQRHHSHKDNNRYDHDGDGPHHDISGLEKVADIAELDIADIEIVKRATPDESHGSGGKKDEEFVSVNLDVIEEEHGRNGNGNTSSEEIIDVDVIDREHGRDGKPWDRDDDHARSKGGKYWSKDADHRDHDKDHYPSKHDKDDKYYPSKHDKEDKYREKDWDHDKDHYPSKYGKEGKYWEKDTDHWDHDEDHYPSKYGKDDKYYPSKHGKEDKYWGKDIAHGDHKDHYPSKYGKEGRYWEKDTDHWDHDEDHYPSKYGKEDKHWDKDQDKDYYSLKHGEEGKYWDKDIGRWIYKKEGKCWKWENGRWILLDIVENDDGRRGGILGGITV